jgi:hypothetical protein
MHKCSIFEVLREFIGGKLVKVSRCIRCGRDK